MKPALVALALVAGAVLALPDLAIEHAPTVENYLRDTLAIAPENAIVVGVGDHRVFGFAYVQRVLGERRDVDYVDARLLAYGWYRDKVATRLGLPDVTNDEPALVARMLATERPRPCAA